MKFYNAAGHEHSFSMEAMNTIKTRRLSDLLCDNTLITTLGTNVFLTNSPKMNCGNCTEKNDLKLEEINLILPFTGKISKHFNCVLIDSIFFPFYVQINLSCQSLNF